ncbi:MAG: nucleoside triphosphate pyrophosphatase, partial [Alphaproteobacteria bacterium]
MTKKAFILASASPRRLQLLQQVGIYPDEVLPANIDEVQYKGENIVRYVQRMALEKAQSVAICRPGSVVLGADTIVVAGRRILPKAEDEETARECLRILSGRRHQVYTAVCVIHEGRVQQAL